MIDVEAIRKCATELRWNGIDGNEALYHALLQIHVPALLTELTRLQALVEWRPISEEKNGDYLVWTPELEGGHHVHVCRKRPGLRVISGRFDFDLKSKPTHLMPLPAPPTADETKEQP